MKADYSNCKSIHDAYDYAENEYNFWERELTNYGYNVDNAIAAAQYYGQMAALATWAYIEHEDKTLLERYEEIRPRLYKEDFEQEKDWSDYFLALEQAEGGS